jgi:potassium-transporting ATPase KdpC subunit
MSIAASFRTVTATLLVCSGLYTGLVLAVGQALAPDVANGQLVERDGRVIGSRKVAQKFEAPHYLWPRPSAADYNGVAASGSNKSPTNPELTARAKAEIARHGATPANPLPAELATASGAGLDPHLSLAAALYQAPRIAKARSVPASDVERLIQSQTTILPLASSTRLVNVLESNLALDAAFPVKNAGG